MKPMLGDETEAGIPGASFAAVNAANPAAGVSPTPFSPYFFGRSRRGKPNNGLTYQESATMKQSV